MKHIVFIKRCLILFLLFFLFDFIISIVLIKGLNKYYGFNENPEILINGSSMAMSGFNRDELEKQTYKQIATYAHEGVSVSDRYTMINHFFQIHPEGIKSVVYEVNPVVFSTKKTAENVYTIFYPYMDDKEVEKYIKENASVKEHGINKIFRTKRFDSRLLRLIVMGYLNKYDNLKTNKLDSTAILQMIPQKGSSNVIMDESNIEIFERTMDLILSHDSGILLVMMPMFYTKLETFNMESYRKLCAYFEDYSATRENVEFLNLNQDSLIYNADNFSDPLHFNVYGQRHITNVISSYLVKN